MYFEKDIYVLALAWGLFFVYFWLNYWVYKLNGTASPIYGILIEKGYQWSFGIVIGMTFILAVGISFLVLNLLSDGAFPFSFGLVVETISCYLIATIGLNLWGKRFLRKQGMLPNPDVGWSWFVKRAKENIEKEKMKHRRD